MCFFRRKKRSNPKLNAPEVNQNKNEWVECFKEGNIVNVEAKGSRLVVYLNDTAIVDKDGLHKLGVSNIISGEKKITLILKENAEKIANLLK